MSFKKPLLSVILPVYNHASTISNTIESILNQSFSNFELIIINNGSTDQIDDILLEFNDTKIKFNSLVERNLVKALNYGIKQAKGEFIARVDADDFCFPDRFENQIQFLRNNSDIGLVSGMIEFVGNQEKHNGYSQHVEWLNSIIEPKNIYLNRFVDAPVSHPSVMFRKSIFSEHGEYLNGDFPEDFELWNRWLLQGVKMAKIDEPVIKWYDSKFRLSRTDKRYDQDKFSKIKAKYFSLWFENQFPSHKPTILIWGNGSHVRKRSKHLTQYGLTISKYIDVIEHSSDQIIHFKDINRSENIFVLNYVSDRIGRVKIHQHLIGNGFLEGVNFYMMY